MDSLARKPFTMNVACSRSIMSCDRRFLTVSAGRWFKAGVHHFPYMSCLFETTNGGLGFHLQHHEVQIKPSQTHRSFLHLTRSARCLPRRISTPGLFPTPLATRQLPTYFVMSVQAKSLSRSSQLAAAMFETFYSPSGPKETSDVNSISPRAT